MAKGSDSPFDLGEVQWPLTVSFGQAKQDYNNHRMATQHVSHAGISCCPYV